MIFLLFITALALSGIAGFYSIVGLIAIFASSPMPIAIMGSTLEVAKLVVASWLYRNWKPIPFLMKSYLTIALVILMFLTSMGIFGFLSKAHLDQGVPTADVQAAIEFIDEKIQVEKEKIDESRKTLSQLDAQVNETLARTAKDTNNRAVNRSITIRRQQAKERAALNQQIEQSQKAIQELRQERAPKAQELRKVEAEVGPLKYIAALIYGDSPDNSILEKSVRWVIILIVSVFDPLAVIMLIAANWSIVNRPKKPEKVEETPEPIYTTKPVETTPEPIIEVVQATSPPESTWQEVAKEINSKDVRYNPNEVFKKKS